MRTYHRATTTGSELRMTIKNVGTIRGSTTVILTRTPPTSPTRRPDPVRGTHDFVLPNVSPTVAYWHAILPVLMLPCSLEVTRDYWEQRIRSDGTPELRFLYSVKNLGSEEDYCVGALVVDKVER